MQARGSSSFSSFFKKKKGGGNGCGCFREEREEMFGQKLKKKSPLENDVLLMFSTSTVETYTEPVPDADSSG